MVNKIFPPTIKEKGQPVRTRVRALPIVKAFFIFARPKNYLWREHFFCFLFFLARRKKYFTANFDTRTRTILCYRSFIQSRPPTHLDMFYFSERSQCRFSIRVDDVFIMSVFRVFQLYLLTSSFFR